jgi:hypothetical protein
MLVYQRVHRENHGLPVQPLDGMGMNGEFTVAYRIPMDLFARLNGVPPAQAERFVRLHGEQNSIAPHQWSVRSSPGASAPVGRSGSRIGDQRTHMVHGLLMSTVCVSGRSDLPVVLLRAVPKSLFRAHDPLQGFCFEIHKGRQPSTDTNRQRDLWSFSDPARPLT